MKACTTALMALSCLAIYCFFISLCKHPPRMCPPESSCLHRGQRMSLAIPSPGMYACFRINASFLLYSCPYLKLRAFLLMAALTVGMFQNASLHFSTLWGCSAAHAWQYMDFWFDRPSLCLSCTACLRESSRSLTYFH